MPHHLDHVTAGFLFDMDGTLVDSTAIVEAAWGRFGAEHGIDPREILAFSHGRQTIDTVTRFLPDRSHDERVALSAALVADEVRRTDGITEVPGAGALMRTLLDLGAPVALVTSAPRDLALNRMVAAGVPVPEVVVTAEDVPNGKPAPDCYRLGAEMLGLPPGDCTAFEDAEAGLVSAVASGAHVVVVGAHTSPTTRGLDRVTDHTGVTVSRAGAGFRIRG
ncbi:HAD-IA family hydrolase [Curtobacterium sp. MCBD17_035]|uniref:HAD-IA family hydrolase n=1 Tax=Curtobacterium sp. MCBD17_035 TaxID=2175673 RepID=UPI0021AC1272|nr:HAD-IA family hydrolase [Curtobacterium sp. MCBD17_035]WIB67651.1 HAD-IA family hydrolase [Curtobacterium sp. MCBD17_035]